MKKAFVTFDDSLRKFAVDVTQAINFNKDGSEQKAQVELLMGLEISFLSSIWKYRKQSREIYKQFIMMIVGENKNILSARPYFREKSGVFNARISPAIREVKLDDFRSFNINFTMMIFIKQNWKGNFPPECEKLYSETENARRILIENNMPLAINRAKLFFKNASQSHMSLMDVVGIASGGLINGVDKYVGAYSRVFRGVCIGRMTGDMVEEGSETMVHFYPTDRHVLYRANSLKRRHKINDIHTLTRAVNQSFEQDKKDGKKLLKQSVTVQELEKLMLASSALSLDASYEDNDSESEGGSMGLSIGDAMLEMPDVKNVEQDVADKEAWTKISEHLPGLNLIDRKLLRMKGVKI